MSAPSRRGRGRPRYPGTFTPAEQRVLEGLRGGKTYQQIADDLGLSYDTVKYHVSNMLSKANVERREDLVAFSRRPGLRWAALPTLLAAAAGAAVLVAGAVFAVVVLNSRGDRDDSPASPEPTAASQPTSTAATTPTRTVPVTGVSIVDRFVAIVESGDMTQLEPLIRYSEIECRTQPEQSVNPPPACPPGQPDSSTVRGIRAGGGCHGPVPILESEMAGLLARSEARMSVYSASPISTPGLAKYVVVVALTEFSPGTLSAEPVPGVVYQLSQDEVLGWTGWCGQSARLLSMASSSYIIEPPPFPPVPPDTPGIGVNTVDELIDAIVVRDLVKLTERTATIPVGCGPERWLPRCNDGQPSGTLVPAVVYEDCNERNWRNPGNVAFDFDSRFGPAPKVVAVARGDGADGVAYWIIWKGHPTGNAGALGVTSTGEIAVIDPGCNDGLAGILARHDDYVWRAN